MIDEQRPNPDQLLAQVQQAQAQAGHGRLKIFFGASAGVGKTYAMLAAAHAAQAQGVPLVLGLIETHGRAETQAQLTGLPLLPRKSLPYRERTLLEFDLDAALAFAAQHAGGKHPPLVLLDELAHSNAPGSRHPKRWQDVQELLAAGVDVWSTMNVQHLESLNDIVGGITGIRVQETVPDTLFDAADEVVVVDLPPDELLARLAAGKVYMPEQAAKASAHFFRKGNLIALRELALRRTADRVDQEMQSWRRQIGQPRHGQQAWSTRDAILACIGPGAGGEAVVRSSARLAAQTGLAWHAIFVDAPSQQVAPAARELALRALRLAQELGATIATPVGADVVQTLAAYAREHNLSRLVVGRRQNRAFWRPALTERLSQATPDMDVLLVPLSASPSRHRPSPASASTPLRQQPWLGYGVAALACAAVALLASPLRSVLELTNIVMLFLLVVVGVALRYGRRPAAFAALLGVALFDFFFVPPILSFHVGDVQYLLTFAVMLMVALVIGQLTAKLRAQAQAATERERRVRGLYNLARELSAALLPEQISKIAADFLHAEFTAPSALLLADESEQLQAPVGAKAPVDMAVAQWCFERGEAAGRSTNTLPASSCLMLPLKGPMRLRGVLAVEIAADRALSPEQRQLLDTCASLLAISIERIHYIQVAQSSTVQMESERLRNSLLAALSHDLRTPLAALLGLSETLHASQPVLAAAQLEMSTHITQLAQRMVAQVSNLLDMARLESGAVHLRREWQPLEEVLSSAIAHSQTRLGQRALQLQLANDLPLLHLDASLFERVFINLFENAAKYTPVTAHLRLAANSQDNSVSITLDDDGPGLPLGREETVFEKFERGSKEAAAPGVGLGLAICRAIVQAHGGSIRGENRIEAGKVVGARFTILLPKGQPPQGDGSELIPSLDAPPHEHRAHFAG